MSSTHSPTFPSLHLRQAHSPTLPSLYLRQSSFSIPSVASSKSQLIFQPFFRFSYVTGSSLTSPGEPPMVGVCKELYEDAFGMYFYSKRMKYSRFKSSCHISLVTKQNNNTGRQSWTCKTAPRILRNNTVLQNIVQTKKKLGINSQTLELNGYFHSFGYSDILKLVRSRPY